MLSVCDDKMTFQIAGKSQLAGKYTKAAFAEELAPKLKKLSGGTFQSEIHDILTSDLHAAVLSTNRLTVNGKPVEYRAVHVWRFESGKPVAWYEYPRDMYQFDTIWA